MKHRGAAKTDFSSGPVWKSILAQAIPLTIAQLVSLLYNVIDRVYLGHMGDGSSMALTGVGLTFPVVTLLMAFAVLFGNGGIPLFAMACGAGDEQKAGRIMGNSFALILISAAFLTIIGYAFSRPILFAFGASEESFVYAKRYLDIYLIGTVFMMITTGMNGYINAQGFARTGMKSVIIGSVANIILDPVLIFALDMGVAGAALATVISQILSAAWVLRFLTGNQASVRLTKDMIRVRRRDTMDIIKLGMSNFIMQSTNGLVQIVCNSTLQIYGGDLYVGIMTVANSIREVFFLPVTGISAGSQPVISFNYGAKQNQRVKDGINFNTVIGMAYTAVAWILVLLFPEVWIGIFSRNAELISTGSEALRIYFFGFVFMAFQFAGQSAFQALGDARHAIFFSLLRKVIIVVPLTLLLPAAGFGVKGVFMAEPISNIIGGTASYVTMRLTAYRKL
jgi:putative MATE family efflux protein